MSAIIGLLAKTNHTSVEEKVINPDALNYGTGATIEISFRGVEIGESVS